MATKEQITMEFRNQAEKVQIIKANLIDGNYLKELDLLKVIEGTAISNNLLTKSEINKIKKEIEEKSKKW